MYKLVMKKLISLILTLSLFFPLFRNDFKDKQLQYRKVRTAYEEKEEYLKGLLKEKEINNFSFDMFIRAFKDEEKFEVWVKKKNQKTYQLLKTYDICTTSGVLGPKRREGDLQIPEGVYYVNNFNPFSSYYLSLGINYPNASDKILGYKPGLGGNIYIHGSCVTIGCIPLTNDKIKEVYVLAVEAKNSGQNKIPVHIFPYRMNDENNDVFFDEYSHDTTLTSFWNNLIPIYSYFETYKKNPSSRVNKEGIYYF